jgi:ADP-heptose:LPS heptosyltransferase
MKSKPSSAKTQNVLLINLGSPAEVILSVPAIRRLREERPDARLSMLVYSPMADIADDLPFLEKTIALKDREYGRAPLRRLRHIGEIVRENLTLIKALRKARFGTAISFGESWHGALIALLCRAGLKAGCRSSLLSRFLDVKLDKVPNRHKLQEHLDLVKALGVTSASNADGLHRLRVAAEDRKFVADFLALNDVGKRDLLIGLDPSAPETEDRWDRGYMAFLADRLTQGLGCKVVIMGDIEDLSYVREMLSLMKSRPVVATGKLCLGQIKALAARCSLIATTNVGTVHLSSGVGTKVIFLHSSENFLDWSPLGKKDVVVSAQMPYRPNGRSNSGGPDRIKDRVVDNVVSVAQFQLKNEP